MKKLLTLALMFTMVNMKSQSYAAQNFTMISMINPETATFSAVSPQQKYSGCYGWYQSSKNKEYAIVGSVKGTYFIDITAPATPTVCDYVAGKCTSAWREIQTYQNYAYIVSDVYTPNSMQIIDMSYLPDSVHVVYDAKTYFENAHTVFIDGNKMYCGGITYSTSAGSSMNVYSLAIPTAPTLIRKLDQDYASISYVHDMFVRNDTVFASCGNQGLHVYKLTGSNTFTALGSLTTYAQSGYNHSSYLTPNGQYLMFCDEVPTGLSIKSANVSNLSNISVVANFSPTTNSNYVAHNPYILGNKWLFVSCYQDGIYLYDISNPSAPVLSGFFDTFPQGGISNSNNYGSTSYKGNWGAYVWLPSGTIIAGDMQNGAFFLKSGLVSTDIGKTAEEKMWAVVFPNPASTFIQVNLGNNTWNSYTIEIKNMLGQVVLKENENGISGSSFTKRTDITTLSNGVYLVTLTSGDRMIQQKITIAK